MPSSASRKCESRMPPQSWPTPSCSSPASTVSQAGGRSRPPSTTASANGPSRPRATATWTPSVEHSRPASTPARPMRLAAPFIKSPLGHPHIELLMREYQERDERRDEVKHTVKALQTAAPEGRADDLRRLLDAHPELLDARGVDFHGQTALHKAAWNNRIECVRLLLERGADVRIRDYGDNAYALHFAAEAAHIQIVEILVEAGSDVSGEGDDHHVNVLGWATCRGRVREDIAEYLLRRGAKLNIWSAIALNRADDVRRFVRNDPSILTARMSRNEHQRAPLHHAAAVNRPSMVRLLIDLGARVDATDETGGTPLTVAVREGADPSIIAMLEQAGATLDL